MNANEIQTTLTSLATQLSEMSATLDERSLQARAQQLDARMNEDTFWNDNETAQKIIAEVKSVKEFLDPLVEMAERINDARELLQMAQEEGDESSFEDLAAETKSLSNDLNAFELKAVLNGPHDKGNCYLAIHAGAGGTESCDWAEMLMRMYQMYAKNTGYKIETIDYLPGEETGIKGITLKLSGPMAFGYLKSEVGVHRLVRISPFDSNARRHTSFCSVDVTPDLDDSIKVDINENDLRIDTYRASGAGGQHVNTTDSAVRITHLPSGAVVQCQQERSQHKNKAKALKMLEARIYQIEQAKQDSTLKAAYGEKGEISWGNQIRSYVLQPYQMIKDLRSLHESSNVDAVLNGKIQSFIDAYLRYKLELEAGEKNND